MDASTDNPNAAQAPSTFYGWHPPEKQITVYLNVEVCDGLGPRATEALKSLPRRGLEVGGLLLGWVDRSGELSVIVQDFEPFEAEHARGPSYSLSETDCGRFEQRLEYWNSDPALSVVGYYRSHTRPGLYLDQDDFRIIREYFSDPGQVCLLVRPSLTGAGTAGFFFWEDGDIHRESSYLEFPFQSAQLSSEAFPIREIRREQFVNAPVPIIAPAPVSVAADGSRAASWQTTVEKVSRWWWIPMAAGLLMAWALGGHHPAPKSAVVAPAHGQSDLALSVGKSGRGLKLSWNRNAPAVQKATSAVLWINDGGRQTKVNLAASEVESGSVVYWPTTDDVGFRLEVPSPPGTVSESVRTLGEGIHGPAPAPERGSVASSASKTDGPAASERSSANARSRRHTPRKFYAEEYEEAADKPADKPSPFPRAGAISDARNIAKPAPGSFSVESGKSATAVTPAAPEVSKKPIEAAASVPASLPAVPAPRPAQPAHVTVSWEPAPQSAFRRVFGKIPGLNRLKRGQREGQAFVPAKPLHSVTPTVPPEMGAAFAGEGPVKVKVRVERSGQISRVELLSDENRLANLAVHAAEQWRFAPAMVGDEPVSSDMILRFNLRDAR